MMLASLKPFCLYSFNVCCASAAVAKLDTIMKYFGFAVVASALFCAGTEAEDAVAVAGVVLRDNQSITGTFLLNDILGDKDRVRIEEGAIITIGATTLILRTAEK